MSEALTEKPDAKAPPRSTGASIIINGRYAPPPEDKDGKLWVRTSANVQASPADLYAMWRNVENTPLWQEEIQSVEVLARPLRTGQCALESPMRKH